MSNDDYIKECGINDHPNPIPVEDLEIITEQIKKCICDIKSSNKSHGTGFFCKLPYPDYFNFKPVLITNYHILKEDDVSENKLIKFSLNKNTIQKEIKIDSKRKIFANKKYDVTIIELNLEKDSIEDDCFLDVDPLIIDCNYPQELFKDMEVYIIGNVKEYTYGKIKYISEDGINIEYRFSTNPGMSGSPIINLSNNKIIGVHKGSNKKKIFNLGTFLRDPIKLFYSSKNINDAIIHKNLLSNENKTFLKKKRKEKKI